MCESRSEALVGSDGGVNSAIGNAGRDGGAADGAEKSALEGLHVRRVHPDQISNAAGKDVAEDAKAGAQDRCHAGIAKQ